MLSRDKALELLHSMNPDEHLVHHALETEAVLRGLADRLGQDPELWGIAGLLHDVDFPATKETPEQHGVMALEILGDSLPPEAVHAIQAHNSEHTGVEPVNGFDYAMRAGESVTGLIAANALVRPGGMEGMKPKSLKKKMKEKAFAANVDRERIRDCEKMGLDMDEFFQIAIDAIAPIADQVGLAK